MFGNLYDDEEDGIEDYELPFATATHGYKYRPDSCAADLEIPESTRDPREFAGLKNQGATCYMNSLFQTLYMIHDFRNAILKMPLCVDDPETPSGFLDGQKHLILYCLQKLFVQLKEGRSISASTIEVTDSFGWKSNQQMVQHDVQEATRELLGVLDRALKGTSFETLVKDIFGGTKANIIEVPGHEGAGSYREELFEDLMVQVKNLGNLETSLKNYFTFENLDGDNQYFSEALDRKVDALKGVKIHKFPKILMISLQRFDLDFNTFQMVKLNEKFEFPLELNMSDYLTEDSPQKGEAINYELLSCIIHIGSVTGGHYKAYIRDYANEGTWDLKLYDREEAKAEAKLEEEKRTKEQKDDKENKDDEQKEGEEEEKTDYNGDFPIPYKNSELGKNWYEFNDSFVSPILPGKLERQFGNGTSRESAYILVYKRKGEGETEVQEDIPSYWVQSIAEMNEKFSKDREAYDFEKNHLEIYLQPEELFDVELGSSLKYKVLEDSHEQGLKIKFTFDHTVGQVKEMIRKELLMDEGEEFEAFETCQLSNDLNQVFCAFSDFKDSDVIKDTKITHFSTWLIARNSEIGKFLTSIKGDEKEPIFINLRNQEEEQRTCFYRDMRCSDFLERLAETYGYESRKTIKATFFVDGVMRRLDRLLYDVEKEADHTLKSLCVGNDSQIVIELKTEEEIKAEEDNASKLQTDFIDSESKVSTIQSETAMDVDKTENIRSVLLHKEEDPQFLERFNVDLNWTIEQLLSKLKQFVGVPESEERRLRREIDNSLIVKEELKIPLKEYPEFQEGGVRLKLEFGRFPSVEELAITVALYGDLDFQQRFYLFKESSVGEGKIKICEGFGVDPNNYKLWRVDMYDEPIYVCKKERQTWEKNMVSNGDLLILKSEADILPEEQCIIDIHETITGIPNDCKAVGHITMRDSDTIESLKESILEMEELRDKEELDNFPLERVRLRIRSRNLFFGKIIRENNKSLKQLKIKSGTHLVVQFLSEPEHLKNNEMILLLRKRDLKAKEYHEFIQLKYSYEKMPTLNHLKSKVSEVTGISEETMSIAKYIPHEYDWKYWDPAREIEVKKKNKKGNNKKGKGKGKQKGGKKGDQKQQDSKEENKEENKEEQKKEKTVELKKLVDFDLRTSPLLLSEGDILGVRDDTEEGALEDDFQTEADIQNKIRLEELKKIELLDKGKEKSTHYDDPFKIYTDF